MGLKLNAIKVILIIGMVLLKEDILFSQVQLPKSNRTEFLNHVMHDYSRNEPMLVVFWVKCETQISAVVTEPIELLRLLRKLEMTDSSLTMEEQVVSAIEFLNRGDTIPLEMPWAKNYGYMFAPKDSKIYRYRNKSIKKILRRFFDKKLEVKSGLSREDESALIVILFERNLPYRISGYGTGIVTSFD